LVLKDEEIEEAYDFLRF